MVFEDDSHSGDGMPNNVHTVIAGIDYTQVNGWPPLVGCKYAFQWAVGSAQRCQCATIKTLFNREVTKDNLLYALKEVGSKCQPGDCFVFYYTGHGDHLEDQDGDEIEGHDECLCTLGPDGQAEPRINVWTRDDDIAEVITQNVDSDVTVLIIADCCHSATVADLSKKEWDDFRVIQLAGAADDESGLALPDMPIFTSCMQKAIMELKMKGETSFAVSKVYNRMLEIWQEHPNYTNTTNYSLEARNCTANDFIFPLSPMA